MCDVNVDEEPNNWLYSEYIDVSRAQKVHITVTYSINLQCKSGLRSCKEVFYGYVMESNTNKDAVFIPSPLTNYNLYRNVSSLNLRTPGIETAVIIPLAVKTTHIVIAIRDQGACGKIHSVKVSYLVCPEKTLGESLIFFPQTVPSLNGSLFVEGKCAENSVQIKQGRLIASCESIAGEWNLSRLEGRCVCKEGMERTDTTCKGMPI